jgi:cytochrome c oxidase assembly protein subunit 15
MVSKSFIKTTKIALVLVYLVIIAGATVRMTGSGMGCPDWPKCFGYYIPPTEEAQLLWKPNHEYKKGQVIILNEKLWTARENFTSGISYEVDPWKEYTKHDYATFNVYHTWIEYVNRLFGALAGLACLAVFIQSFAYRRTHKKVFIWAGISLFLLLFNAWLGATVVYSVLNPIKITTHMLAALLTVAALVYLLHIAQGSKQTASPFPLFRSFLWAALALTLIQVIFGTQVRQDIDTLTRAGVTDSSLWLENPDVWFYVHRSLSFAVLFVNVYVWTKARNLSAYAKKLNLIMLLILAEVATGISMAYFDFPFGSQALHLVLASLLFGVQISLLLQTEPINPAKRS